MGAAEEDDRDCFGGCLKLASRKETPKALDEGPQSFAEPSAASIKRRPRDGLLSI